MLLIVLLTLQVTLVKVLVLLMRRYAAKTLILSDTGSERSMLV